MNYEAFLAETERISTLPEREQLNFYTDVMNQETGKTKVAMHVFIKRCSITMREII